jgi:hypothetical protein
VGEGDQLETVVGWLVWGIEVACALVFTKSLPRLFRQSGGNLVLVGAAWGVVVQTLFLWVVAITFLVSGIDRLHMLWVTPLGLILIIPLARACTSVLFSLQARNDSR